MHNVEGRTLSESEYAEYCTVNADRTARLKMPLTLAEIFPVGTLESEAEPLAPVSEEA